MRPDAKSGALLQVSPLAPRFEGARLTPLITIQAFCVSSVKPPSMSTVTMAGALGLAIRIRRRRRSEPPAARHQAARRVRRSPQDNRRRGVRALEIAAS